MHSEDPYESAVLEMLEKTDLSQIKNFDTAATGVLDLLQL